MHALLLLTLSLGQANPALERAKREFAAGISDRATGGTERAHFRAAAEAPRVGTLGDGVHGPGEVHVVLLAATEPH